MHFTYIATAFFLFLFVIWERKSWPNVILKFLFAIMVLWGLRNVLNLPLKW